MWQTYAAAEEHFGHRKIIMSKHYSDEKACSECIWKFR
jgi:hypothetical protein